MPVPAPNLARRDLLFAGSDAERLEGLYDLTADPDIRAIFFARGGSGCLRLLPEIDWGLLGRHPRAWVGYSDLTPLLNGIVERAGLVAFHGPMVGVELAAGLRRSEARSLLDALAGRLPLGVRLGGSVTPPAASGCLKGGCLSLLAATVGTDFFPDLNGALLFWEDVGEPLHRLDRMLTQLRLSGTLAAVEGIAIGRVRCTDYRLTGPKRTEVAGRLGWAADGPLIWGVPAGHGRPNHTLPLGLRATVEGRRLVFGSAREL